MADLPGRARPQAGDAVEASDAVGVGDVVGQEMP